jgi:SMC interacting uncharacterized protein involved in chromosome segregation
MKPLNLFGQLLCRTCFLALLLAGSAQAQFTPYPDNDARTAILKERQRIDALRVEFDKLREDAQAFRSGGEANRREADAIRRDVNAVQTNLNLMIYRIDAKIDDGIKPLSESVQRGVDELLIQRRANISLQSQLEQARGEIRQLRGKTEELEAQISDIRRKIESK